MRLALPILAVHALTACNDPQSGGREFFISDAPGSNSSLLIERHSGCIWAITLETGDTGASKTSYSQEEFQRMVDESDQFLDDAKKYGRFRLIEVKSAKSNWCRTEFGMTAASVENAK